MFRILSCVLIGITLSPMLGATQFVTKKSDDNAGTKTDKSAKKKATKKAAKADVDPIGKPDGSIVEKPARFYIWYDEAQKNWRIRTCSVNSNTFSGSVSVRGGKFKSSISVGKNLKGKKEKNDDLVRSDNKISFSTVTSTRSDGVDFKIEGENPTLQFDLMINGKTATPAQVRIGKTEAHPGEVPFSLPGEPKPLSN